LRSFWFEFVLAHDADCPPAVRGGVGVTARDRSDALGIVADRLFDGRELPAVRHEVEDVVFHRLDPWHVLPHMVDPRPRGVWFPALQG
jgi:hypothetical protein